MTSLVDRVTARALRLALLPETGDDPARQLAALAGGRRWALQVALARLHRGVAERDSRIGHRAAASVEAAMTLVSA